MTPLKGHALRKIANNELHARFGDLSATTKDELATSLVRQWLANDGHAGLVARSRQLWFELVPVGEGRGVKVRVVVGKANWARILANWKVDEDQIPGLLHQLNGCQCVLCRTADGRALRLRIEP